jgi:hypothetical protein
MQFEAKEPIHARFATLGAVLKDFVRVNAPVVTDPQTGRINERDAGAFSFSGLQVAAQGHERRRHQLDEAVVGDEFGESPTQMLQDMLSVEGLEVAVTRRVKEHDNGHHFRETQSRGTVALARHVGQKPLPPSWFKELAKVVYVAENR